MPASWDMPPLDRALSPLTGWTRDHWVSLAERLLATARRHGTSSHARIHFPGDVGGYGHDVDGLEGFARSLMAAGFLAAGDPTRTAPLEWYAHGFAVGPDPTLPISERWVRPSEHDQAKVEACTLALILHLTRPYLWDTFSSRTQELIVDYFAEWIHASYPNNNWVWFRLIVQQFMRSVGGPWSTEDLEEDLAFNESCYVSDGWYRDGLGRTFDYYGGWVFQVYPLLWCDMLPDDPQVRELRPIFQARLNDYLTDAVQLIGTDGAMMAQGRSLIYRYAQAASIWMGAITDSPALTPGQIRRATSGMVSNFVTHGVPDDNGQLTMGWYGPWRKLAQSYSGPGSPYWACKGLLGLTLPANHPVWTATEEPLGTDCGDHVTALKVPGWILSSAQGITRLTNHGTDHAKPGDDRADSPLYARLGYSTATFPLLDATAWTRPIDQSVCLIDAQGRASHRTGFTAEVCELQNNVGVAASTANAHWVDPLPTQFLHGSGYIGDTQAAGRIQTISLVRGPWEVRLARVDDLSVGSPAPFLRIGGWAVSGKQILSTTSRTDTSANADPLAIAETDELRSSVWALTSGATPGVDFHEEASPLGGSTAVPYLDHPVTVGAWVAALVALDKVSPETRSGGDGRVEATILSNGLAVQVHTVWPDGLVTDSTLRLLGDGASSPDTTMVPLGATREGEQQ